MNRVDSELLKEIKSAQGDGSRESKRKLFTRLRNCQTDLEDTKTFNYLTPETFGEIFRKHDRATVAMILAATITARIDRLNRDTVRWAMDVMTQWTTRPQFTEDYAIRDNLHPSKIELYAGKFIRLTTEC